MHCYKRLIQNGLLTASATFAKVALSASASFPTLTIMAQRLVTHTSGLLRAGDQAMHLLYRLQHGQVYKQHQPNLAIVLIGTNDLGAASCLGGEPDIFEAAAGAAERYYLDSLSITGHTACLWVPTLSVRMVHLLGLGVVLSCPLGLGLALSCLFGLGFTLP